MCSAAAAFTGVGELRHIAPDPWAIAAQAEDPSVEASKALRSVGPAEDEWVVSANVFFLLGVATKRGREAPVLLHNLEHEPETAGIVVDLLEHGQTAEIWTRSRRGRGTGGYLATDRERRRCEASAARLTGHVLTRQ